MDKLQALHENLVSEGYKLGSLDEFKAKMSDPETRATFHSNLTGEGYKLGSLDEFSGIVSPEKKNDQGVGVLLPESHRQSPTGSDATQPVDPSKYETKLTPTEEAGFQKWLDDNHSKGKIGDGDYKFYKENGHGYDYDFRAAYKAGLTPDPKTGHWGDLGKKPNHETFSNESKYNGVDGVQGGHWDGEKFVPPTDSLVPPIAVNPSQHADFVAMEKQKADERNAIRTNAIAQTAMGLTNLAAKQGISGESWKKSLEKTLADPKYKTQAERDARAADMAYNLFVKAGVDREMSASDMHKLWDVAAEAKNNLRNTDPEAYAKMVEEKKVASDKVAFANTLGNKATHNRISSAIDDGTLGLSELPGGLPTPEMWAGGSEDFTVGGDNNPSPFGGVTDLPKINMIGPKGMSKVTEVNEAKLRNDAKHYSEIADELEAGTAEGKVGLYDGKDVEWYRKESDKAYSEAQKIRDSRHGELRASMDETRKIIADPKTPDFTRKAAVMAIKDMEAQDYGFLNPETEVLREIAKNKDEVATASGGKGTYLEQLRAYQDNLLAEKQQLEEIVYGHVTGLAAVAQEATGLTTRGRNDDEKRLQAVNDKLKSVGRVVMLNEFPKGATNYSSVRSFAKTLLGEGGLAANAIDTRSDQQAAIDTEEMLMSTGLSTEDVAKPYKEKFEADKAGPSWLSFEHAGSLIGMVGAMTAQGAVGGAAFRGMKLAGGLALAKTGLPATRAGQTIAFMAANSSLTRMGKFASVATKALEHGLQYQTIGTAFHDQSHFFNLTTGVAGFYGASLGKAVIGKMGSNIAMYFGNRSNAAAQWIYERGKAIAANTPEVAANIVPKGIGGVVGQGSEGLVRIWQQSDVHKTFWDGMDEQFGKTTDDKLKFFLDMFFISGFMPGHDLGKQTAAELKERFADLSPESQQYAETVLESTQDIATAHDEALMEADKAQTENKTATPAEAELAMPPEKPSVEENLGSNVQYNGVEGVLQKDAHGNLVVLGSDGAETFVESGLSGKSVDELGIRVIPESTMTPEELISEGKKAPEIQADHVDSIPENRIGYDHDAGKVSLYGNEYDYVRANSDAEGNTVSITVKDAKGKEKTIRNEDAVHEIEIQKMLAESENASGITPEEITKNAEENGIKPKDEVAPQDAGGTQEVQQEGSTTPVEPVIAKEVPKEIAVDPPKLEVKTEIPTAETPKNEAQKANVSITSKPSFSGRGFTGDINIDGKAQGHYTVEVHGDTAHISDIQIGYDEAQRAELQGKGHGTEAYRQIAAELATQGKKLTSTDFAESNTTISPQALSVWAKLEKEGLARKTGETEGVVLDRFTGERSVQKIPTYEYVSDVLNPRAQPVDVSNTANAGNPPVETLPSMESGIPPLMPPVENGTSGGPPPPTTPPVETTATEAPKEKSPEKSGLQVLLEKHIGNASNAIKKMIVGNPMYKSSYSQQVQFDKAVGEVNDAIRDGKVFDMVEELKKPTISDIDQAKRLILGNTLGEMASESLKLRDKAALEGNKKESRRLEKQADNLNESMTELFKTASEVGTEAGRAGAMNALWPTLGKNVDLYVESRIRKVNEDMMARKKAASGKNLGKQIEESTKAVNEAKKKNADAIADATDLQLDPDTVTPKKKGGFKETTIRGHTKADARAKMKEALKEAKGIKFGGTANAMGDPNAFVQMKAYAKAGYYALLEGAITLKDWTRHMKANAPELSDDELSDIWKTSFDGRSLEAESEALVVEQALDRVAKMLGTEPPKIANKETAKAVKELRDKMAKELVSIIDKGGDLEQFKEKFWLTDAQVEKLAKDIENASPASLERLAGNKAKAKEVKQKAEFHNMTEAERAEAVRKAAADPKAKAEREKSLRGKIQDEFRKGYEAKSLKERLIDNVGLTPEEADIAIQEGKNAIDKTAKRVDDARAEKAQKAIDKKAEQIETSRKKEAEQKAAATQADYKKRVETAKSEFIKDPTKGSMQERLKGQGFDDAEVDAIMQAQGADFAKGAEETIRKAGADPESKPKAGDPTLRQRVQKVFSEYFSQKNTDPTPLRDRLLSTGLTEAQADYMLAENDAVVTRKTAELAEAKAAREAQANSYLPKAKAAPKTEAEKLAAKEKAETRANVKEVVRDHFKYNVGDENYDGRPLHDKLMEAGLDADQATRVEAAVKENAQKIMGDAVSGALDHISSNESRKAAREFNPPKKGAKTRTQAEMLIDKLVDGDITDRYLQGMIAYRFGMGKPPTAEQMAKIRAAGEAVKNAPDGILKPIAMKELMHLFDEIRPRDPWEFAKVFEALIFSSTLNSVNTFGQNTYSVSDHAALGAVKPFFDPFQWGQLARALVLKAIKGDGAPNPLLLNPLAKVLVKAAANGKPFVANLRAIRSGLKEGIVSSKWNENVLSGDPVDQLPILERKLKGRFGRAVQSERIGFTVKHKGKEYFVNLNPWSNIFGKDVARLLNSQDGGMVAMYGDYEFLDAIRRNVGNRGGTFAEAKKAVFDYIAHKRPVWVESVEQARADAKELFDKTGRQVSEQTIQVRAGEIARKRIATMEGITDSEMDSVQQVAQYDTLTLKRTGAFGKVGQLVGLVKQVPVVGKALTPFAMFVQIPANFGDAMLDQLPVYGNMRAEELSPTGLMARVARGEGFVGRWFEEKGFTDAMKKIGLAESASIGAPKSRARMKQHEQAAFGAVMLAIMYFGFPYNGDDEDKKLKGMENRPDDSFNLFGISWKSIPSLAIPAIIADVLHKADNDPVYKTKGFYSGLAGRLWAAGTAMGEFYTDQTFMRGLKDFGTALRTGLDANSSSEAKFRNVVAPYMKLLMKPMPQTQGLTQFALDAFDQSKYTEETMGELLVKAMGMTQIANMAGIDAIKSEKAVGLFGEEKMMLPGFNVVNVKQLMDKWPHDDLYRFLSVNDIVIKAPTNDVLMWKSDPEGSEGTLTTGINSQIPYQLREMTPKEWHAFNVKAGENFAVSLENFKNNRSESGRFAAAGHNEYDGDVGVKSAKLGDLERFKVMELYATAREKARKDLYGDNLLGDKDGQILLNKELGQDQKRPR